jgi:hypothetical protein
VTINVRAEPEPIRNLRVGGVTDGRVASLDARSI